MTNSKKVVTKMTKFVTKHQNHEKTGITYSIHYAICLFRRRTTITKLQLRQSCSSKHVQHRWYSTEPCHGILHLLCDNK